MSEYVLADKDSLTRIANALRNSTGENNSYTVPELSSAAVRSISSGGGSGFAQADWNENDPDMAGYIKNRTHWEESDYGFILPETTLEGIYSEEEMATLFYSERDLGFRLEVGKTYTVCINGEEIILSCTENEIAEGLILPQLGGIINKRPFFLLDTSSIDNSEDPIYIMMYIAGQEETITISVKGDKTIIHPIDLKYLPNLRGQKIIKFKVVNNSEDVTVELNFPISELANMDPLDIQQSFLVEWSYNENSAVIYYSSPFNVYFFGAPTSRAFSGEFYYVRDDDRGRVIQKIMFAYNLSTLLAAKGEGKFNFVKTEGDSSQGGPNLIACFDSAYGGIPQEVLKSENKFTYYFTDEEILALADKIDELRAARAAQ